MGRRIENEILAELDLARGARDRRVAARILVAQRVLRQHCDARGWRAFLAIERMTDDRAHRDLLRAIRIAFRRGLVAPCR